MADHLTRNIISMTEDDDDDDGGYNVDDDDEEDPRQKGDSGHQAAVL